MMSPAGVGVATVHVHISLTVSCNMQRHSWFLLIWIKLISIVDILKTKIK